MIRGWQEDCGSARAVAERTGEKLSAAGVAAGEPKDRERSERPDFVREPPLPGISARGASDACRHKAPSAPVSA